ncbi:MAG: hypothetical protein NW226_14460 [Microscillaceae bacterium]|nr:hypothetical protein [Microscillaceae bacterium]
MTSFVINNRSKTYIKEALKCFVRKIFPLISIFISISAFGQAEIPLRDSIFLADCAQKVKELIPIFTDEVVIEEALEDFPDSIQVSTYPYSVYALQHEENWILLMVDVSGFYSYTQWEGEDSLSANVPYVDYTLCEIIQGKHFEQAENKKKETFSVGDMTFSDYYVLTKEGKKLWDQVVLMKYGKENKWSLWKDVFQIGKLKEIKKIAEKQKEALNTKNKEIEDLKKKLQDVETLEKKILDSEEQLKVLNEQLKACERPDSTKSQQTKPLASNDTSKTKSEPNVLTPNDSTKTNKKNENSTIQTQNTSKTEPHNSNANNNVVKSEPQKNDLEALLKRDSLRIKTQLDSLKILLKPTENQIDSQTRKNQLALQDSLTKAYESVLDSLKILMEENMKSKNITDNFLAQLPDDFKESEKFIALQQRADSLREEIRQIDEELKQENNAENHRTLSEKRTELLTELEVVLDELKNVLDQYLNNKSTQR